MDSFTADGGDLLRARIEITFKHNNTAAAPVSTAHAEATFGFDPESVTEDVLRLVIHSSDVDVTSGTTDQSVRVLSGPRDIFIRFSIGLQSGTISCSYDRVSNYHNSTTASCVSVIGGSHGAHLVFVVADVVVLGDAIEATVSREVEVRLITRASEPDIIGAIQVVFLRSVRVVRAP